MSTKGIHRQRSYRPSRLRWSRLQSSSALGLSVPVEEGEGWRQTGAAL